MRRKYFYTCVNYLHLKAIMGIDLNHPDELDWMARGRRGDIKSSLFTNRTSDQQLEGETKDELLKQMFWRLVERDIYDEPDYEDPHDIDRVVSYAERMLTEVGQTRRETIERRVWSELDADSDPGEDFATRFLARVADRIIDVCVERGVIPGRDDVVVD